MPTGQNSFLLLLIPCLYITNELVCYTYTRNDTIFDTESFSFILFMISKSLTALQMDSTSSGFPKIKTGGRTVLPLDGVKTILVTEAEKLHRDINTLEDKSYFTFLHNTEQYYVDAPAYWQPAKVISTVVLCFFVYS